jgi:hypothetical protein
LRLLDDAKVGQGEVARDAEDLAGAMILEGVEQGFNEVHGRGFLGLSMESIFAHIYPTMCSTLVPYID